MWTGWFLFDEAKRKMEEKRREVQNRGSEPKPVEESNNPGVSKPTKVSTASQADLEVVDSVPNNSTDGKNESDTDEISELVLPQPIISEDSISHSVGVNPQKSRFETVNCLSELEVVKKVQNIYNEAKANNILGSGIQFAEHGLKMVATPASYVLQPCLRLCDRPLSVADKIMCTCINCVMEVMPCKSQICNEDGTNSESTSAGFIGGTNSSKKLQ